ncbi:MAG: hypothetical protein ACYDEY_15865 [Acidimicrobiales bacterium]
MTTGVNTTVLLGYAQEIALVLCLAGVCLAATAVIGQSRSGLASSGPWRRLLTAGICAVGIGAAPLLVSIAFLGHRF